MAAVDDRRSRVAPAASAASAADQQAGDRFDRPLGGRQPDAHRPVAADVFESFEGQREVRAALVAGDGVDLVDDDGVARCAAHRGSSRR